jgi:hypothetical protein
VGRDEAQAGRVRESKTRKPGEGARRTWTQVREDSGPRESKEGVEGIPETDPNLDQGKEEKAWKNLWEEEEGGSGGVSESSGPSGLREAKPKGEGVWSTETEKKKERKRGTGKPGLRSEGPKSGRPRKERPRSWGG